MINGHWLITGATGFLGSHLVKRLLDFPDIKLTCLIRSNSSKEKLPNSEQIQFVTDLSNDFIYDGVIHLATLYSSDADEEIDYVNYQLPKKIFELGFQNFICADTSLPPELNAYASYKHKFREFLKNQKNSTTVNLVLEQFFGKGDGRFVNYLIDHFKNNSAEIPLTLGEQKRDFIYVSDVVEAFVSVIQNISELEAGYHEYEVGSGEALSIKDIVQKMKNLSGNTSTELAFGKVPYRDGEVMLSQANKKNWPPNWKPLVSLDQGIKICLGD